MTTQNHTISQGYKDSPLGVIPQEWEVKRLEEVSVIKGGYAFDSSRFKDCGKYQVVKMSNLYEGLLDLERSKSFIDEINAAEFEYILKPNDILITLTGTIGKRDYGYTFQISRKKNLLLNQRVAKIQAKNIDDSFLYFYTKTLPFLNGFFLCSRGGTGNQSNVSTIDVGKLRIVYPPLPEQQKIAEILSVWDRAIEVQMQLITSLQTRKHALMQQLLTGKKRLKGFSGKWEMVELGKIFIEIADYNDNKGHTVMTISSKYGLVSQKEKFDKIIAGDSLNKYTLIRDGDFAYNKGNSKLYEMGCIFQLKHIPSALVPFVYICFRAKRDICSEFYKHWFVNHGLDRQLKRIITSGARSDGLLNVNSNDFFLLALPLPPLTEQTAIAEILSAADKEIAFAQEKLAKMKEQKKGLMQVLLTGKRRVEKRK